MTASVNVDAGIKEYLGRVRKLYGSVREWALGIEGDVQFRETEIELNEEFTGPYRVPSLEVVRGAGPDLRLMPRGIYMLGGRGRVRVQSRLGSEMIVWVEEGGPGIAFQVAAGGRVQESTGRPMFPGVPEGWAWVDDAGRQLVHLDRDVFVEKIVGRLSS